MHPQHWLTDRELTEDGGRERARYTALVDYLRTLHLKPYQVARTLHLMQNLHAGIMPGDYATPPHTVNICVNNACNFRCSYCDLHQSKKRRAVSGAKADFGVVDAAHTRELPLELCQRIVDEVAWFRPTIRVPWMEPLLYRDLFKLIAYTKDKGLDFSMLTNGLLLRKYADRLNDLGVDALRISLDGPEAVHEAHCGVKGAYKVIMAGMRRLVELKKQGRSTMELGCYFTLTDKNHTAMLPTLEALEAEGLLGHVSVSFYMFNYISRRQAEIHNAEHAAISGVTIQETSAQFIRLENISIEAMLEQKEAIQKRYGDKGVKVHFRPDFTEKNLRQCLQDVDLSLFNARCDVRAHTLFINPDGAVKTFPQCILPPVGNIRTESLLDIWNGEAMRGQRALLREHGLFHGCKRCWCVYNSLEDTQNTWKEHLHAKN